MADPREFTDEDFDRLLLEKQHKELLGALKKLTQFLERTESSEQAIYSFIQSNNKSVVNALTELGNIKIDAPVVHINQDAILKELQNVSYNLKDLAETIRNKKPVEWEFKVDRGYGNIIEKITAKPK